MSWGVSLEPLLVLNSLVSVKPLRNRKLSGNRKRKISYIQYLIYL